MRRIKEEKGKDCKIAFICDVCLSPQPFVMSLFVVSFLELNEVVMQQKSNTRQKEKWNKESIELRNQGTGEIRQGLKEEATLTQIQDQDALVKLFNPIQVAAVLTMLVSSTVVSATGRALLFKLFISDSSYQLDEDGRWGDCSVKDALLRTDANKSIT